MNSSVHCSVQMLLLLAILLFICLTSLLSLSVRELSNKHVKFRVVWRNVLDSLFAMPGRLCLASLSRAGVHASFSWRAKKKPFYFSPITLPTGQAVTMITLLRILTLPRWLWEDLCDALKLLLPVRPWHYVSQVKLVELPWAGQVVWASGMISLISSVVFVWSCKYKLLSSVPHCMTLFSQRKELLISEVFFYLSQVIPIIPFKNKKSLFLYWH